MDVYKDLSKFFEGEEYLLGDSGYPLREFLITPYKRPEADDIIHRRYNTQLAKVRIRVEQSFGLLKERFCRLKDGFVTVIATAEDHKIVCYCITVAVVLHNFCIAVRDRETEVLLREFQTHDAESTNFKDERDEITASVSERERNERAKRKREKIEAVVVDKCIENN